MRISNSTFLMFILLVGFFGVLVKDPQILVGTLEGIYEKEFISEEDKANAPENTLVAPFADPNATATRYIPGTNEQIQVHKDENPCKQYRSYY